MSWDKGMEVCGFRNHPLPWVDIDGRHVGVFLPLPFGRSLWLYYSSKP